MRSPRYNKGALSVGRTYSATLEGQEQANIVPKISERIAGVHVQVGMTVPANRLILTLDKAGASSQFFQAEAGYRNAEKSLERMKSLYAEGAVSLQTLDATQTAYDVARANYVAARSMVELTTPIAGVVTAVNANIGDLAVPGAVLATVAKIDRMKAIFNLNETDVTALAIGQTVRITSEARPDLSVKGSIVQISRSADVRSRSFEVKAHVYEHAGPLVPTGDVRQRAFAGLLQCCGPHGAEYRDPDGWHDEQGLCREGRTGIPAHGAGRDE